MAERKGEPTKLSDLADSMRALLDRIKESPPAAPSADRFCPTCRKTRGISMPGANLCWDCGPSLEARLRAAGVPESDIGFRLTDTPAWVSMRIPEIAAAAAALARHVDAGFPRSVYLYGKTGTGKSALEAATLAYAAAQAKPWTVRYVWIPRMLRRLRSRMDDSGESEREIFEEVTASRLVALDELGTKADASAYGSQVVFEAIEERRQRGRPIIATGNLTPEQLRDRVDDDSGAAERVFSRMQEWLSVPLGEFDLRGVPMEERHG